MDNFAQKVPMKRLRLSIFIFSLLVFSGYAQEYYCEVISPKFETDEIDIQIDAGRQFFEPDYTVAQNKAILKGMAYASFIKVKIRLDDLFEKIVLIPHNTSSEIAIDLEGNLELINAFEGYDEIKSIYEKKVMPSEKALVEWMVNNSELIKRHRDSASLVINTITEKLNKARIKFIREYNYSFYSYEVFKTYLLNQSCF